MDQTKKSTMAMLRENLEDAISIELEVITKRASTPAERDYHGQERIRPGQGAQKPNRGWSTALGQDDFCKNSIKKNYKKFTKIQPSGITK
ncbi:hypothetical protein O181_049401 [Austropuccinia psidii MF-1]|uniref:Uncharacterized protein n=1 Tax=Austropuccinia psidii MF-1 TaxID=1389203 RepID=A0A9Q3DSB7_9BASI|nr:hypothetical protein [Austropuccinia psidii MF-1]